MKKKHTLFDSYLRKNDGRYTQQKQEIATEIFKIKGHFEVENFIDDFRTITKKLSRATVYRTIKQLLDADEVFLTSSGSFITPILKIDKKKINNGKIGNITLKLAEMYSKSCMNG